MRILTHLPECVRNAGSVPESKIYCREKLWKAIEEKTIREEIRQEECLRIRE